MAPVKISCIGKKCFSEGYKYSCCLINTILVFIAFVQFYIILLNVIKLEIPTPEFLKSKIEQKLIKHNLVANWESINLDLAGGIHVRDLSLFLSQYNKNFEIAHADAALVNLNVFDLLLNKININKISLNNAELFAPNINPLINSNNPLVKNFNGKLIKKNGNWELHNLILNFFNLSLFANGQLPELTGVDSNKQLNILDQYKAFCFLAYKYKSHFEASTSPQLKINFLKNESGEIGIEGELIGKNYQLNRNLTAKNIRASFISDRLTEAFPISLQIADINFLNIYYLKDIKLQFPLQIKNLTSIPDRIKLSVNRSILFNQSLMSLYGEIDLSEYPIIKSQTHFIRNKKPVNVISNIDSKNKSGQVQYDGEFDLKLINKVYDLNSFNFINKFKIKGSTNIKLSVNFDKNFKFNNAEFETTLNNPKYKDIEILNLFAKGTVSKTDLSLNQLEFDHAKYHVSGSYAQNFITKDYRFLLSGDVYPHDLNSVLDDWWDNIWNRIELSEPTVKADIDISGQWGTLRELFVYGYAKGNDFLYKNLPVDFCSTKIFLSYNFTYIYDLVAQMNDKFFNSDIQWYYIENQPTPVEIQYSIFSRLDLDELEIVTETDLSAIKSDIIPTAPPELKITGKWLSENNKKESTNYKIEARLNDKLNFYNIPIDRINFNADINTYQSKISNLNFDIQNGHGKGDIVIENKKNNDILNFDISLSNMDYMKTLETIKKLNLDDDQKSNVITDVDELKSDHGKIDIKIKAKGTMGDLKSFVGEGNTEIKGANIWSVQLFGQLSRLLEKTWASFTTLPFNNSIGDFKISDGIIHFPKLSISGPNAEIQTSGFLNFTNSKLDFKVKLFPMEKSKQPMASIISPILKPFSHALELRLKGTLDEPNWRLSIDPRNLFQSDNNKTKTE